MLRLLLALAVVGGVSASQTTAFEQELRGALDRIQRDYSTQREKSEVVKLVLLDQQLRELIPSHEWQSRPSATSRVFRQEYEQLGVSWALFESDLLSYSGKLLREAHALDPLSLRAYTLYSAVFVGEAGESGVEPPHPTAAKGYLKEFPRGPFAIHANVALAYFYDDLFKFIDAHMKAPGDQAHDCFLPYLDKTPLSRQRQRAQQSAVVYYEQLTRLLPQSRIMGTGLAQMRTGRTDGWHYCGD